MGFSLVKILNATNYTLSKGTELLWESFPDAEILKFENIYGSGCVTANVTEKIVYKVEVKHNQKDGPVYCWFNPDFLDQHKQESLKKGFNYKLAHDGKNYAITESFDDIVEKVAKILANEEYNPKVVMDIPIDDETFLLCAKAAHALDITFNEFVNLALIAAMERESLRESIKNDFQDENNESY